MFCQNMAPRRAVNARDQPPPPPLPRTAEELNALLEERISVAIAIPRLQTTELRRHWRCSGICTLDGKTEATIRMSKCTADQQVTFAIGLVVDEALTWWNLQVQTLGDDVAYGMSWDELKEKMREKYCSRAKLQRLET
ncbi:hypothetical protein Hanom_Chr02g00142231 [Helianthus anomalus]